MSTLKVDGIRSNSASSDAITLASDGTCTANITNNLSNRNLVINGAMRVAQRGTSSTAGSGYHTIDRYSFNVGGTDETPTVAQVDVSSGTTPYTLGFKKALKITNGNQTGGAGAADYMEIYQYLEDQDISNSGWNFKSSSSYITVSFWIKSSVAQKFTGFFYTNQAGAGDSFMYSYQIDNGSGGNLSADTWTKITHSIPGNSSLSFNNDNTRGLAVGIYQFNGTNYTTSDKAFNAWSAWDSSAKTRDMTSTWYTTNDATLEITGLQLEVGPVATPFEHRSYGDELLRCYRYFVKYYGSTGGLSTGDGAIATLANWTNSTAYGPIYLPVEMRAAPSPNNPPNYSNLVYYSAGNTFTPSGNQVAFVGAATNRVELRINSMTNMSQGNAGWLRIASTAGYIEFNAEL